MSHFLQTDIREQQKYEKRMTYVDNKVNDLRCTAVLQINIIPLPVTMNRKIKTLAKLHFWQSQ